jgi:dehypoxanthine futalosine cyclase
VHSLNINPTNTCENECYLCAFWRPRENDDAYMLSLETAEQRLRDAADKGLTDLHIVGGITPQLTLEYYEQLFRIAKSVMPEVCIQALTAVEIHFLAQQSSLPVDTVLARLKSAGLDALPGGGAEIFAPEVRARICPNKISGDDWLHVHGAAHRAGLPTNATMLFGHVESPEDVIDHLFQLRDHQDQTGGFAAFIPLPFHPCGTRIEVDHGPTGYAIARTVATARIVLDNIPHIRVLANYVERKLLEVLCAGGVDDLGGTSQEERIAKAAGAPSDHRFVSVADMFAFSRRLGLTPRFVNSAYCDVDPGIHGEAAPPPRKETPGDAAAASSIPADTGLQRLHAGNRIDAETAVRLHDEMPFQDLGQLAHEARLRAVPGDVVTYVIDRNISLTNVCTAGCRFCAFHVDPGSERAFLLSMDDVVAKVDDAIAAGATQILIQGGLHPDLGLEFFESLLARVKQRGNICVHSLSPTEIADLAEKEDLTIKDVLGRLRKAGLDSLPGGGAEILVDAVRRRISPRKLDSDGWLGVMRTAHELGMKTTATMVYGFGESTGERVEHLLRVRELQDETGGFTAFIPWSFQPAHTQLDIEPQTGIDYLRMVALARLVLDNIPHIQAGWVTEGPDLAQLALHFGADDFGGVLMEEQVVRSTGVGYAVTRDDVTTLISDAGFRPVQRTTQYAPVAR